MEKIKELKDTLTFKNQLLNHYEENLATDKIGIEMEDIEELYEEAGAIFTTGTKHTLDDVLNFHKQIIANRKVTFRGIIKELKAEISGIEREIESLRIADQST